MKNIIIPDDLLPISGWPRVYFYTLSDPITGEIVYVGKTSDPQMRYLQHCRTGKGRFDGNAEKTWWLVSLLKGYGALPIMTIVACIDNDFSGKESCKKEFSIINQMRKEGHPILNKIPRMNWRSSAEHEKKIKNSMFWKNTQDYMNGTIKQLKGEAE